MTHLPAQGVLAGTGALAGKAVSAQPPVRVGDMITVNTLGGGRRQVRLTGLADEPIGTAVHPTDATARPLTGLGGNTYQQ